MKKTTFLLLFLFLVCVGSAQIRQSVNIPKQLWGSRYRASAFVRSEASDSTAVQFWAQQQNAEKKFLKDKSRKLTFNKKIEGWRKIEISGRIKDKCSTLSFGIWCNRSAKTFSVDDVSVEVEQNGAWQNIAIANSGFELKLDSLKRLQGWSTWSGYLLNISPVSKSGAQSLSVALADLVRYGDFAEHGQSLQINGVNIYYETYGEGEPLLLLHGNNESISSFRYQIDQLKKNYKVIAVDSRGQGKSTIDKQKMNYELMASDMKVLLDHLKIDSVNILGWSDGGNTGLVMAIKYPNKVRSLITMGANLYPNKKAVQKKFMRDYRWTIRLVRVMSVLHPKKWKTKLRVGTMVLRYPRMKPVELKSIKAPVLVLAGEKDIVNEDHSKLIAANIASSKLTILKGLTHYAPQDDPDYFNREVESFLKVNSRLGSE